MDPRSAPSWVGEARLANQLDDLGRDRKSGHRMAALPSPVQSKSLSVPSDHSLRFDDRESGSPAAPKTHEPDTKKSIGAPPTQPMTAIGSLENQELMPQG